MTPRPPCARRLQDARGLRSAGRGAWARSIPTTRARTRSMPMPSAAKCSRSSASRAASSIRQAQREVARGDVAPRAQCAAQHRSQAATQRALQRPRHAAPWPSATACPAIPASGAGRAGADRLRRRHPCDSNEPWRCRMFRRTMHRGARGGAVVSLCCRDAGRIPGQATERVLRALYSATLYLLLPVTVYHLIWRGFRQREYFLRWNERYAVYAGPTRRRARRPGLGARRLGGRGQCRRAAGQRAAAAASGPAHARHDDHADRFGARAGLWGDAVRHVYLPYDLPGAVSRFLAHFQPRLALIMETELWPNLLLGCRDHGVPAYIVNARLSERSLRGYRVLKPLVGRALRSVRGVLAQSDADADRFRAPGRSAGATHVTGNLNSTSRTSVRRRSPTASRHASAHRPAWIAASTHVEEEAAVIAIHRRLRERWPSCCCCGRRAIPNASRR